MVANQRQQSRIDRGPDAAGGPAVLILDAQAGHVVDRHLDTHVHRFQAAGVDDGDLAIRAPEETRHLLERALRRREPDTLRLGFRQRAKALEAEGEMGATFRGSDRVDLVDDEPADRGEDAARRARQ